jgi:thiamine-phosphate pyrophosphorylase
MSSPAAGTARSAHASDLRERIRAARLYLVCDSRAGRPEPLLTDAARGGVEVVQLREKSLSELQMVRAAQRMRAVCEELGVLFFVNDSPSVALAAKADGVHVGQRDMRVAEVRELVGPEMLIGLSTHTRAEVHEAAEVNRIGARAPDYLSVGPVFQTPTKPGRPAVGVSLVRYAAMHVQIPFFAIGGIARENVREVVDAGARRVAVVRAIADAGHPEQAARTLREQLAREPLASAHRAPTAL